MFLNSSQKFCEKFCKNSIKSVPTGIYLFKKSAVENIETMRRDFSKLSITTPE